MSGKRLSFDRSGFGFESRLLTATDCTQGSLYANQWACSEKRKKFCGWCDGSQDVL